MLGGKVDWDESSQSTQAEGTDAKALLRLVHPFYARGEWIATDTRSRYHAVKVLGGDPHAGTRWQPAATGIHRQAALEALEARGAA